MAILLDSNIFISFANRRDRGHERARTLLDKVRKGEFGVPYTSDYVFDEAVTTALARTGRLDIAVKVGKIILGSEEDSIPSFIKLVRVDEKIFAKAWTNFKARRFRGLSFTDHTSLALLEEMRVDSILSFDKGFDGLAARIS
ncbi:MAG: type II toxin-antitoxin system VapC family toxin [Candidatus Geothermarchaeales archaeon]